MRQHLVMTIRLHDSRYHGAGEWPPSPARVFQALVAGTACGNRFPSGCREALEWLESLPPPVIAAPPARRGQRIGMFVPNNDADALGGDLSQISDIRVKKVVHPWLIEGAPTFLYAWPLPSVDERVEVIHEMVARVYQLGRGVDMAWALSEIWDERTLEERLARHPGTVHEPISDARGMALACPMVGTLESLVRRYDEGRQRLRPTARGQLFVQASKPRFAMVAYDAPAFRRVYELRRRDDGTTYAWPLVEVSALVERIRDAAAARLRGALPELSDAVERVIVGRKRDGSDAGPVEHRLRLVPLPSVGHSHADRGVRRVSIELPSGGPLSPADVHWAFSALDLIDPESGEEEPFVLVASEDERMLRRYANRARRWRTVTAAVLPEAAARRRIEPTRQREKAKGAKERADEEQRAMAAVITALRHAGVRERPVRIHVQREPFEAKGARAERFAKGTRFAKERLWHVDIEFEGLVQGPLVLGDGRFLGLGVMAPVDSVPAVHVFAIETQLPAAIDPCGMARALRRAVLARVQDVLGPRSELPTYFSGHGRDGRPARSPADPHLAFVFDAPRRRLLVLAPHVIERRPMTKEEARHLRTLERALAGFRELRAGSAGLLTVRSVQCDESNDPLFAASREWHSVSRYQVTRHAKAGSAHDAFVADVRAECDRLGLPCPQVTSHGLRGVRGVGLTGDAVLSFPRAVRGPLLLGRSRFVGGGLFEAADVVGKAGPAR